MQFIKRFGKQLGFVVLMGSAMVSVSSVIAQVPPRETTPITINMDVIIDSAYLQKQFPGDTTLILLSIGGIHRTKIDESKIGDLGGTNIFFNPFITPYGNSRQDLLPIASQLDPPVARSITSKSFTGSEIIGTFSDTDNTKDLIFGISPNAFNPPALKLNESTNYGRCAFQSCVLFHYGYELTVESIGKLNPGFDRSFFTLVNNGRTRSFSQRNPMASPEIELRGAIPQEDTPDEFLVVFSEQRNPERPGVAIVNWTEFPIKRGQTPTIRFTNTASNFDSVTVSNTRVLRSATKIPLEQLTATDLPPTPEVGFVEFPEANGIVLPGQTRDPVTLTGIPVIGTPILDTIASFNGTSDFLEIPKNENLNFGTGDLSISAWVKTTSTSGLEVILDKRVETTGPVQGYSLSNSNGNLLLQLADGVGNQFTNYVSNISIADGNWHHVAVTVDRDQPDGGRWYLDGVEIVGERFNPTRRGSLSNSKPLVIGRRSDNPGWPGFFNGQIGFVRLDKRVLSSQEIKAIAAKKP
ncbi:LamG domain-containing protein [Nostoc sp. FACHB-888]|uniref:LamG domain-containing protein n=1 Tax=Nostoc sp. FACHB-888 TaxID=2692842 RepID=UPI0016835B46|nr:LamG domain-containing protein [Nostoc sp. FACHB-888]MBD2247725.1 LamG domain-containing protein [Nostoc sp. FACHB-888]